MIKSMFKSSLTIVGLFIIATLILGLYWCSVPVLNPLPKPTGSYGVGFKEYFIPTKHGPSYPINVQVWYPADEPLVLQYPNMASKILWAHLKETSYFHLCAQTCSLKSYSKPDALLSASHERYPVLLFTPGYGAPASVYYAMIENLASQGFVVVGINHPEIHPIELPAGQIIKTKKLESYKGFKDYDELWQHLIDQAIGNVAIALSFLQRVISDPQSKWYNRIHLESMGCFGHSFGAMIPVFLCRNDPRFVAGIAIDGWLGTKRKNYEKIPVPFLFIINDTRYPASSHKTENKRDITKICDNSGFSCSILTIPGAGHNSFSDAALLKWPFSNGFDVGNKDPYENFKLANTLVLDFFSKAIPLRHEAVR